MKSVLKDLQNEIEKIANEKVFANHSPIGCSHCQNIATANGIMALLKDGEIKLDDNVEDVTAYILNKFSVDISLFFSLIK